jgi:hypothetical protein
MRNMFLEMNGERQSRTKPTKDEVDLEEENIIVLLNSITNTNQ